MARLFKMLMDQVKIKDQAVEPPLVKHQKAMINHYHNPKQLLKHLLHQELTEQVNLTEVEINKTKIKIVEIKTKRP